MFREYNRLIEEMATPTETVSVVDVYDIAALIGKEFELIIDNYGPEAVTELMPKVITVLEHLENLAARNQKENAEIGELRYAVEKLQAEKVAKAEQRERYEQVTNQIFGKSCSTLAKDLRFRCESFSYIIFIPISSDRKPFLNIRKN